MVLRPNEDDKRQNYDASTASKAVARLGERRVRDETNLILEGQLLKGFAIAEILPISVVGPSCWPGRIP